MVQMRAPDTVIEKIYFTTKPLPKGSGFVSISLSEENA